MTPEEIHEFKKLQERLRALISNQMTYPKTLIGIARGRCLNGQEISKAYEVLETCSKVVDAEMTLFALMADKNF